jgi:hypothetical protein
MVIGDTPRQQKQFMEGLKRAAIKAGLHALNYHEPNYTGLFGLLDELGREGFQRFYTQGDEQSWRPADQFETCRRSTLIDIHDMVVGNLEERWPLLTEFLGFQADELSAQLSDSEYVSLPVLAHVQGLQASFVQGSTYEAGVSAYLQRALVMIRRKLLPERLCEQAVQVFGHPTTIRELRANTTVEAQRTFGLSETQWVCLLFSPFADNGANLERFLRRCHPGMLVAMPDLHRAMQGQPVADQIMQWMIDVSGLPVSLIVELYAREPVYALEDKAPESASGEMDAPVEGDSAAMAGEWTGR